METNKEKFIDISIKDKGYGYIRVLTPRAKKVCYGLGLDNELLHYEKNLNGEKVCQLGETDGSFQLECGLDEVNNMIRTFKQYGLIVESEL